MLMVQVVMTPRCRYPVQLELIEPEELRWLMCAPGHLLPCCWCSALMCSDGAEAGSFCSQ